MVRTLANFLASLVLFMALFVLAALALPVHAATPNTDVDPGRPVAAPATRVEADGGPPAADRPMR